MALATDSAIEAVLKFIEELKNNNFHVQQVFIFGSYAKGSAKEESDIDVAIVAPEFTGDWFDDRRRIVPLRRKIDNRIEPMPFSPEDFDKGGILIDEIKKTGKRVSVSV